jgi:hypothetical protein
MVSLVSLDARQTICLLLGWPHANALIEQLRNVTDGVLRL